MSVLHVVPLAALLACSVTIESAAQANAAGKEDRLTPPQGLEELVKAIQTAHRSEKAPRTIGAFRANIDVKSLSSDKKLELSIDVRWKAPELMLYEILQGETPKKRGIDQDGEWESVGRAVLDLQEQRSDAGLLEVQRHLQLCKQIVRLLDPADVISELKQPAPVRRETIALSRAEPAVACDVVEGYLKNFPLYHERVGDDVQSIRCELWFGAQDHRLRAVKATPLDQTARQRGEGEWIVLLDHDKVQGLLLPQSLVLYALRSPGREALVRITINRIEINPNLEAADFKRPSK